MNTSPRNQVPLPGPTRRQNVGTGQAFALSGQETPPNSPWGPAPTAPHTPSQCSYPGPRAAAGGQAPIQNPWAYAPTTNPASSFPVPGSVPSANTPGAQSSSRVPVSKPSPTNEQLVGRILAAAGGLVTLIGLVLLVVMAAQEGLLTPGVRVGSGAGVSIGLATAAEFVRRREGGRVGSVALLGTGAAGAFFDVYAITRIYDWVPASAGLGFAFFVAALAAIRAVQWDEEWLYIALCLGVGALTPFLTSGATVVAVGFMVVVQAAGVVPEFTKGWDKVALARTTPAVFVAWSYIANTHNVMLALVCGAVVSALGMGTALAVGMRFDGRNFAAGSVGAAFVPVLMTAHLLDAWERGALGAAVAVVSGGLALSLRGLDNPMRVVLGIVAGAGGLLAALALSSGEFRSIVWFVLAIGLFVSQLLKPMRDAALALAGAGVAAFGALMNMTVTNPVDLFYRSRVAEMSVTPGIVGLTMIVTGVVGLLASRGSASTFNRQVVAVASGAIGLYGYVAAVIGLIGHEEAWFFTAHLLVTTSVVAGAVMVLLAGLKRPEHLGMSTAWGLTLVALAMTKLFFFDLAYMGMLMKALTFIVAGLVMLAAGTRYAQNYAVVRRTRLTQENHQGGEARVKAPGQQDTSGTPAGTGWVNPGPR